jgi:hypothetical protein
MAKRGYKEYAKHLRTHGKKAAAKIARQQGKREARD